MLTRQARLLCQGRKLQTTVRITLCTQSPVSIESAQHSFSNLDASPTHCLAPLPSTCFVCPTSRVFTHFTTTTEVGA